MNLQRVARTWWPLAFSWLLMGAELPALSAVVARLPDPRINLAAYGGVVFPLALIIESPIIMLLAASTALSKDTASYRKIWKFMMIAGASLTALHILIAWTPLYYVVVEGILGAPKAIVEPARIGLKIMLPWTWTIAYRRFNQGVMIRFGHSRSVGAGTVVRLAAGLTVLFVGLAIGTLPGIVVATTAVAAGVTSEAIFAGRVVRPVLRNELAAAPPVEPPLTYNAFFAFYIPLVLTALLGLIAQPIGSAALSRMPEPISSLAVWPVVTGLVFMVRGLGIAFNEVVVALLDEEDARPALRRFTLILIAGTSAALFLLAATPLSDFWFATVSALPPDLAALAGIAIWFALPLPALSTLQSWFQGQLLHARRTRGITESVVIFLVVIAVILTAGVLWGGMIGLYVGMVAMVLSMAAQTAWLGLRAARLDRDGAK
ncbi:MAG: hypothetical protein MUC34_16135 [Anaerolineae bacterium]|nr:hypothetical protein [Anaerolineae bacterium]